MDLITSRQDILTHSINGAISQEYLIRSTGDYSRMLQGMLNVSSDLKDSILICL